MNVGMHEARVGVRVVRTDGVSWTNAIIRSEVTYSMMRTCRDGELGLLAWGWMDPWSSLQASIITTVRPYSLPTVTAVLYFVRFFCSASYIFLVYY